MNKTRMKSIYKTNKYIINTAVVAMLLLGVLSFSVVLYKFKSAGEEIIPNVDVAELQQEATLDGITDTRNMVLYFLEAVGENDLDMALRGCPIDEIGLGVDTARIIEKAGMFSNNLTVAPSKEYKKYFPLASAELTAQYTEKFLEICEAYDELGNVQIKDINYVYPGRQMESSYLLESQTLCDMTGAEAVCEMTALLESETGSYAVGFTLAKYYDYWKVLSVTSGIAGTSDDEFFLEMSETEYKEMTEDRIVKKLEKQIYGEDYKKEYKTREKNAKEIREIIENGEALLPANYFVINNAYGENPQDLIEKFTAYVEKGDINTLMNYGHTDVMQWGENLKADKILQQGAVAEQIKGFYYNLLNEGKEQKGSLEELGTTSGQIVKKQNPENMFYMDLMKVTQEQKGNEYEAFFWYGGEIYAAEFQLSQTEQGWQIEQIKNVRKSSQKEYDAK